MTRGARVLTELLRWRWQMLTSGVDLSDWKMNQKGWLYMPSRGFEPRIDENRQRNRPTGLLNGSDD
jgi:hypothetical protein